MKIGLLLLTATASLVGFSADTWRVARETGDDVTTAGTTNLRFDGPFAENELAFAYVGTGAAELLTSRCEIGGLLFLR